MTIMGTFIVGAFVISTFFTSFEKEFRIELLKKKQLSRSGLFAGYAILDLSRSGVILSKILSIFYKKITAETEEPERLKQKRESDFVSKASSLHGFIEGLENHLEEMNSVQFMQRLGHFDELMLKKKLQQKYEKELQTKIVHRETRKVSLKAPVGSKKEETSSGSTFRRSLFVVLSNPFSSNLVTFLVILQCGFLAFYGFIADSYLDIVNIFICFIFFIEICLKIIAYGWHSVSLVYIAIFSS
jgi:hypothetical protein